MQDHEIYAQAFVQASESNQVKNYLEFKEVVKLFKDNPKFVDALLFNRDLFDEFKEDFESLYSPVVYNFLDILIGDGLIDQIFNIEISIRDILVEAEVYNYCVVESASPLSESFEEKLNEMIHKRTDGNVEIVKKVNSKLKSGIRMYLNDESIDLSITGRLERLLSEVS